MTLPTHPYWLSVPTMVMGYLTGSNKYLGNPVDKSTEYSFLGTSTLLWSWRNFAFLTTDTIPKPKPGSAFIGSVIGGALISSSVYCMGHLIGVAANKSIETGSKIRIDKLLRIENKDKHITISRSKIAKPSPER